MPRGDNSRGVSPEMRTARMRARVREVEKMMGLHINPREICSRIGEKWGVTERTVRNDIRRVYAIWREEQKKVDPESGLDQIRVTLKRIVQMALAKGDLRSAIAALKDMSDLGREIGLNVTVGGTIEHKSAKESLSDLIAGIATREGKSEVASKPN